jgi:predicted TIM-barrel fold metal-dependent hydrolase
VPDIRGGGFAPWADGMRRLAAAPNVMVKLSGITAYCAPGQVTLAAITPYVDHVLDCFGPSRMLWGGDWPVVNLGAGLPGWLEMTRTLLSRLSRDEQAAIGSGNARKVYRL